MAKSLSKFVAKIFLEEVSGRILSSLIGILSLPSIYALVAARIATIAQDIRGLRIQEWQLLTICAVSSWFLLLLVFIIVFSVHLTHHFIKKRKYFLFDFQGYKWKILLPERQMEGIVPLCPKHGVFLMASENGYQTCPVQKCDVKILYDDCVSLLRNASFVGLAKLDGHYKE